MASIARGCLLAAGCIAGLLASMPPSVAAPRPALQRVADGMTAARADRRFAYYQDAAGALLILDDRGPVHRVAVPTGCRVAAVRVPWALLGCDPYENGVPTDYRVLDLDTGITQQVPRGSPQTRPEGNGYWPGYDALLGLGAYWVQGWTAYDVDKGRNPIYVNWRTGQRAAYTLTGNRFRRDLDDPELPPRTPGGCRGRAEPRYARVENAFPALVLRECATRRTIVVSRCPNLCSWYLGNHVVAWTESPRASILSLPRGRRISYDLTDRTGTAPDPVSAALTRRFAYFSAYFRDSPYRVWRVRLR